MDRVTLLLTKHSENQSGPASVFALAKLTGEFCITPGVRQLLVYS